MKKYLLAAMGLLFSVLGVMAQSTIYSQTFASALGGWTSIDNNGSGGKWVRGVNPFNTADTQYYGPQNNGSPTASNGFALALSNLVSNAMNTDLVSPAINCTGQTYVALEFYQWLAVGSVSPPSAQAGVYVSTDSLNWAQVYDAVSTTTFGNPQLVQFDISSYASGHAQVWIKFNYQANNDLWWTVDDIKMVSLPALGVATVSVNAPQYIGVNNFPVSATIENMGGPTLTSVTLNYTVNGQHSVTQTFTGLSLTPFQIDTLVFSTLAPLTAVAIDTITVTATDPNGQAVTNPVGNVASTVVTTLSHVPVKNVLVEEFTTAVCGYCPGGATRIGEIMTADGAYAVPVAIHAGFYTDGMTNTDDDNLAAAFTNSAPTAMIDRILYPKETQVAIGVAGMGTTVNQWKDAVEARHKVTPPVSIVASNNYNSSTRVLNVTITSKFYGPATGSFRMNCYLVEDNVTGSGANYDQHSYYHDSPTTLNPWLGQGTLISAGTWSIAGYVHHHVERKLLDPGVTWGTPGIIPNKVGDDSTYTRTYTYTIPATINTANVTLAAFVYDYSSNPTSGKNEVQNVLSMQLNSSDSIAAPASVIISGIEEKPASGLAQISLHPNPASDVVYLNYTLNTTAKLSFQVYNMVGQLVSNITESNFSAGDYSTLINTSKYQSGIYFVNVRNEGSIMQTLKFVINR